MSCYFQDMLKSPSTKPGDVMECLIQNKQNVDMDEKCRAGIEHHQILTLKNYRFSFKFKVRHGTSSDCA